MIGVDLVRGGVIIQISQGEAGGIPEFVAEISSDVEFFADISAIGVFGDRHAHVLTFGGHLGEAKAHGVGAVRIDDFDGVDAVAL